MFKLSQITIWTKNRKTILTATILFLCILSLGIGYMYYQSQLNTTYNVFLNGNKIDVVDDPEVIQSWINNKIKEESSRFKFVHIRENNMVTFQPEERYKPSFDNQNALWKLEEEFVIKANDVKVIIDGQIIGYASDEASVQEVLNSFKRKYVPEELLLPTNEKYEKTVSIASINENEKSASLDQPQILEVALKQVLQMEGTIVEPTKVLSNEQLNKRLSQSKKSERLHTIEAGDVLGTIAMQYGLSTNELLELNPGLTKDSILQIGQQLVVALEEPIITVSTIEKIRTEETIDFKVETRKDPNMYKGESRIEQEGKKGKKLVE